MNPGPFKNRILRTLDSEPSPGWTQAGHPGPPGSEIENPGEPIANLIFLEDGIGSMTTTFRDGFQVEVGMFGVESVMGGSALIGTRRSLNKVYMQLDGYGFSTPCPWPSEFSRFGRFHDLVLRYIQALFIQACQSAGCNSHHNVVQRLSRWLLLCADRCESTTLDAHP